MRVLLVGQAAFAEKVLEGLVAAGDEIVGVVCPPDRGPKPDAVKAAALARGIPVHQWKNLKGDDARAVFTNARADLGVLAYVTQIVPESLIGLPRHGTICFHPSLLPKYRGGSAIPWQLINGETTTGVTVFWTDAGIDTGPILLQRTADVGPDDTAGSLYYQKLFPLGVDVVLESVRLVREGRAPRVPQDDAQGTYDPLLTDAHARIDWTQPQQRVHDLVRGCDPQPGAHTTVAGKTLRLFDPRRVDGAGAPGTVLAVGADGITIATAGGAVRCARARGDGAKAAAAEVAVAMGIAGGTRLG
ncbi:MAG: methionyl-tRNA formyltransferase [bacterium]|nr:methionyl-tRNA formyltransferase [bacterium]